MASLCLEDGALPVVCVSLGGNIIGTIKTKKEDYKVLFFMLSL